MPRFSVIIPCHNAARTLRETIDSLLAQSFTDWEAICIDDGSTDGTASRLASFAMSDLRIRVVSIKNSGPSQARNIGAMRHAEGELLAFLDADDLWSPTKLAEMDALFGLRRAPDAAFARVAFFRDDPWARVGTLHCAAGTVRVADFLGENPVCTLSNLIVRRSVFLATGGFDPGIVHNEDVEWLVRLLASGAQLHGVQSTQVHYRASDFGLSADLEKMHDGWRAALDTAHALGVAPDARGVARAEALHFRYLARRALRLDAPALGFALRGLAVSPAAFLGDLRRGLATAGGALLQPVLPRAARRALFAE